MAVRTRDIWEHQHIRLQKTRIFVAVRSVSVSMMLLIVIVRLTPGQVNVRILEFCM
jgi:hypothetical protein